MELGALEGQHGENLAYQAGYDSQNLARHFRLSQRQLQRKYRSHLGVSPQKWLIGHRIKRAKILLAQGQRVKAVAEVLGYTRVSHFCMQFKAETGVTPSEFVVLNSPVAKV